MEKITRIIKVVFMAVIVTLAFNGCKKYLEQKSDDRLAVPKTLEDLQALMDDAATMNQRVAPSGAAASADDYFLPDATLNRLGGMDTYLWRAEHISYPNDWSFCYSAIYNTNLVLDILPSIRRSAQNATAWDQIKGSALFFRAYFYSLLISQYGKVYDERTAATDPGIFLRLQPDFNKASERANVASCYRQILDDAAASLELLPATAAGNLLRPSKAASLSLLARTTLYMGNYGAAVQRATEALQLSNNLMDYNGDPFVIGLTATVPFKRYNPEIIFYAEQNTTNAIHTPVRGRIDTVLYASYAADDLRKAVFFQSVSPYQKFKGNYTANANWFFAGFATDELYLTRAEGFAQTDELRKAEGDLNALMFKRYKMGKYVAVHGLPKAQLLGLIKTERRKELLMRGMRWADLKRYNRDGAGIVVQRNVNHELISLPPNDARFNLPFPEDIRLITGSLR